MTRSGIYQDCKGGLHRVLFCARQATRGQHEGRLVVIYVDLKYGTLSVCDEDEFNEKVPAPPERGFNPGVEIPRFMFTGDMTMSDKDAEDLYDGLLELVGRKPTSGT